MKRFIRILFTLGCFFITFGVLKGLMTRETAWYIFIALVIAYNFADAVRTKYERN